MASSPLTAVRDAVPGATAARRRMPAVLFEPDANLHRHRGERPENRLDRNRIFDHRVDRRLGEVGQRSDRTVGHEGAVAAQRMKGPAEPVQVGRRSRVDVEPLQMETELPHQVIGGAQELGEEDGVRILHS